MKEAPSFSIVMPTFERRPVVCEAVHALGGLNYDGPVEIIILVDGSTDGTADALRAIECPFGIRVIETENGGPARARNIGAAHACGEIILFLDDDMICHPAILKEHARMFRKGADAVVGKIGIDPRSTGFLAESTKRWLDDSSVKAPLSPFDVFSGQLSIRRSVFDEVGGFDEALTAGTSFSSEDSELGARLVPKYRVRHCPTAISSQVYVVSPREFVARGASMAEGHLRLLRKHPYLARELLSVVGPDRPMVRFVYRPLSHIPFAATILSKAAIWVGETALRTRLHSSHLIARFVSGARTVSYWSALRSGGGFPTSEQLLVLAYHAIADQSDDPVLSPYGVAPPRFIEQLESLSARGFCFVGPNTFSDFVRDGTPLPRRAVLLTFDDCYSDLLPIARDVLRPRGIEAIAFSVTATRSNTNEWDERKGARRMRLLEPNELKELASMGVEIGSHSRTHGQMTLLAGDDLKAETAGSAADLVAAGLPRPRFFAYPYGVCDAASKEAVERAGYLAAFGAEEGRAGSRSNRFELPRVVVLAEDGPWRFRLKTAAPVAHRRLIDRRDRIRTALSKAGRRVLQTQ